jgi:hypothetical protein
MQGTQQGSSKGAALGSSAPSCSLVFFVPGHSQPEAHAGSCHSAIVAIGLSNTAQRCAACDVVHAVTYSVAKDTQNTVWSCKLLLLPSACMHVW